MAPIEVLDKKVKVWEGEQAQTVKSAKETIKKLKRSGCVRYVSALDLAQSSNVQDAFVMFQRWTWRRAVTFRMRSLCFSAGPGAEQ